MLILLLNYLVILVSIVIFTMPFYIWYKISHKEGFSRHAFSVDLENFFSSYQANWLVFTWAASEAIFWFVIPEFLLLLVVFMRIRRKRQLLIYDISGTIVGTVMALLIHLPERLISQLPYIQPGMITQTKIWYEQGGILGLMHQPFSGVPYKVFTHLAPQYSFPLLLFIVFAVTVRMFRYLIAYGLFISLYPKLHKIVLSRYVRLCLIAIAIFSVLLYKTYSAYS